MIWVIKGLLVVILNMLIGAILGYISAEYEWFRTLCTLAVCILLLIIIAISSVSKIFKI